MVMTSEQIEFYLNQEKEELARLNEMIKRREEMAKIFDEFNHDKIDQQLTNLNSARVAIEDGIKYLESL